MVTRNYLSKHPEHRFFHNKNSYPSVEREVRTLFERMLFSKVLEDPKFKHLWDKNKLESLQPPSYDFRHKPTWYPIRRKMCGVQYRNPRAITRTVGLSRYVFKQMLERGVLPGMYRTGW